MTGQVAGGDGYRRWYDQFVELARGRTSVGGHHPDGASRRRSQEQLDRLRQIASSAPQAQTWHARFCTLDLAGVQVLQDLFDVPRLCSTPVRLVRVAVQVFWHDPAVSRGLDVAALLEAQADRGPQLGQPPLA
jgi:hypothetical protein